LQDVFIVVANNQSRSLVAKTQVISYYHEISHNVSLTYLKINVKLMLKKLRFNLLINLLATKTVITLTRKFTTKTKKFLITTCKNNKLKTNVEVVNISTIALALAKLFGSYELFIHNTLYEDSHDSVDFVIYSQLVVKHLPTK